VVISPVGGLVGWLISDGSGDGVVDSFMTVGAGRTSKRKDLLSGWVVKGMELWLCCRFKSQERRRETQGSGVMGRGGRVG
jgi:hypothetical protein